MTVGVPAQSTDFDSGSELLSEARRLVARATALHLPLRLLGGLAVRLRQPNAGPPLDDRAFADIDFISIRAGQRVIADFAEGAGYAPDRQFNVVSGAHRLIFHGGQDRKLEFFVNTFEMCHRVPMDRALIEPETIPLAELLLTKLQVVKLTEKDLHDVFILLHTHAVSTTDGDDINSSRVAQCCAGDWGLWRTATLNLSRAQELIVQRGLPPDSSSTISDRLTQLQSAIDGAPKTMSWKLRARLGERIPWYEDPDEV